ncbi:PhoU domain-containing protein [Magnetococcales bacterium HHB-1]
MTVFRKRFEQDLEHIKTEVTELGGYISSALEASISALFVQNDQMATRLIISDQIVNRKVRALHRLCHQFIACHLPGSSPLRLISSVIRLANELERMGDYIVNINRQALHLIDAPPQDLQQKISDMFQQTHDMLNQSLLAFEINDAEKASTVMNVADHVQLELNDAFEMLVFLGETQKVKVRDLFDLYSIFYMLERVSDRARNLCEETLFIAKGEEKPEKFFHILFIDQQHQLLSPMACAIAKTHFESQGAFFSAGISASPNFHPFFKDFLKQNRLVFESRKPQSLQDAGLDISQFNVLVLLQGRVKDLPFSVPFHAVCQEWDVDAYADEGAYESEEEKAQRFKAIYREIFLRLNDLMTRLRGEEVLTLE